MKRQPKSAVQFAVCINNKGYRASLEIGKLYRVIPDPKAAMHGYVRIVDESGEDYLFARNQFAFVEFPQPVRRKILALQRAG